MAIESYLYGDPAKVLEVKQSRQQNRKNSCLSCVNLRSIEFGGEVVIACSLNRTAIMRRCDFYKNVT